MNNAPKKYVKINGVTKLNPEWKRWKDAFGTEGAEQSNKVSKVQINLYASKLTNVAGFGKGISDPFAVVTLLASNPSDQPQIIGKTEVVKNNLSPKWTTSFILDYSLGVSTRINIAILDEIRKGNKAKPMGSALFEIGEILGSRGNVKAKKMKSGGTLFVHAMAAPTEDAGRLILKLQGHKLKNVEGFFSKSDPFVEISAKVNSAGGLTWQPVFRCKHIDNSLNPVWEEMDLNVNKLCQGDRTAPILIAVYDWEKSGKHRSMGSFETNVKALMASVVPDGMGKKVDISKAYSLVKSGKDYGKIVVTGATITGATMSATTQGPQTVIHHLPEPILPPQPPMPAPSYSVNPIRSSSAIPRPGQQPPMASAVPIAAASTAAAVASAVVAGSDQPSYGKLPLGISGSTAVPPPNGGTRPKFVDYLTGGLELQMCVAIDFTGSNGDPRKPGTLHYIHRDGSLNDYEKAITAVGAVVARYDSDQKFPVWGFGAKFRGIINHCFQVGPDPELSGIQGILDGYRRVFRTGLTMSGPTVFAECITKAAQQARAQQAQSAKVGKQSYHILLILTDGAVTDVEHTKRALIEASDAPLSIIIVGIGTADFSTMQFLDDFLSSGNTAGRDICQFVEFHKHQHNRENLTKETLDEVPDQLVDYFYDSQGIMPHPPLSGSKFSVVESDYNPGEDIDIELNFDGGYDGEIFIENPSAGLVDDTKYDTYHQYGGALPVAGAGIAGSGSPPRSSPYNSAPNSPYGRNASPPQTIPGHPNGLQVQQSVPTTMPQVFQVQVPPNGYPGMQLQIQNPFTGQQVMVTVPQGVQAGQTFAVA
ncbi:Copine-6 [Seminavis robusta]|uniref:Copine-6 n=1 Tax=Seminavis robusta TaxID=568900 RepID=A0A9N8EIV1_9STRA|nr:Copine-6 [Seminavis robusta]|eukprot:Sro1305_g261150.1 Copine-6 (819) ;mRNA; f:9294-11922